MSVLAEFVGGPLDGELREMPDGRPEWRFPYRPYMSSAVAVLAETPNERIEHHELIYRRSALRLLNDPSGKQPVRYLFVVHASLAHDNSGRPVRSLPHPKEPV